MKKTHLLFGIRVRDLSAAHHLVESTLAVQLRLHESRYRGGEYYRAGDVGSEHLILQRNYDESEDEWAEPNFSNFDVLLYVNETERSADLVAALSLIGELLTQQEL